MTVMRGNGILYSAGPWRMTTCKLGLHTVVCCSMCSKRMSERYGSWCITKGRGVHEMQWSIVIDGGSVCVGVK